MTDGQRAQMNITPFSPFSGNTDERQAHAAEYTAYYLGKIAGHLEDISIILRDENTNSSKISSSLSALANIAPKLVR